MAERMEAFRGSGIESILAADCGSVMTSVALIDRVDGAFRLIARGEVSSSFDAPWSDVTLAVRQAVRYMEGVTGRRLLDEQTNLITPQKANGDGVDAFVLASSAGAPLNLLLVGMAQDPAISSARYVAEGTYAVVKVVSPVVVGRKSAEIEAQISALRDARPEVILIVGGTDKKTREPLLGMSKALSLAFALEEEASKPQVLFAGHPELHPQIVEAVGSLLKLRSVENIRPSLDTETGAAVLLELENLYHERKMGRVPGFGALAAWSPKPAVPSAKALSYVVRYLAESLNRNVIGVDLGGTSTAIASVLDKRFSVIVRGDLGVGSNVGSVLKQTSAENVLRWVPGEAELELGDVHNILLNKELHPNTVPQLREELLLEQALAKEALRLAWLDVQDRWAMMNLLPENIVQRERDLIIGTGRLLARAPTPGQAALMLLDVVQPVGLIDMTVDAASLVVPLGAVATICPLAAAQVLHQDALLDLGMAVVPVGEAEVGETAIEVKITYQGGRVMEVEVPFGSLEAIPLPVGEEARLELRPAHQFDIGQGPGKAAETGVIGSLAGVLVDARGRPLPLPESLEECRAKVQEWMWNIGA